MRITPLVAAAVAVLLATASASAQTAQRRVQAEKRPRLFVGVSGGVQAAAPKISDSFTYEVNAEPGTVNVEYPAKAAVLADVTAGLRLWKSGGIAISATRATSDGNAHIEADIPHPFFDNQDRHVSGDAGGVERSETALHLQLFLMQERGRWKIRVMGGGSYFRVEQDTVTEVNVNETFPFDTATFGSATTVRADGTGPGFNVGGDVTWMATRRVGIGALVRYARGSAELNAGAGRNVSLDAGGLQVSGGVRFAF